MTKLLIKAAIYEIDNGEFYHTKLYFVPRVGELIHLNSHVQQADNRNPNKYYEVVQVSHNLDDISEKLGKTDGYHLINIFVKPSDSKFFDPNNVWGFPPIV